VTAVRTTSQDTKYLTLMAVLHASLFVMAPVLSSKVVDLPFGMHLLAGSMGMTLAFGFLDVVNQVWGLKPARVVALIAMVARLMIFVLGAVIVALPGKSSPGFERIASESLRIFLAGEATHFFFQVLLDTAIFDWVRRKINKGFWLRYGLSNLVSMVATSGFFTLLATSGRGLPSMEIWAGTMAMRLLMMIFLTPIFSGLVAFISWRVECES
jgi:uncharacterized integral membrane protein (TIGR00697 family)